MHGYFIKNQLDYQYDAKDFDSLVLTTQASIQRKEKHGILTPFLLSLFFLYLFIEKVIEPQIVWRVFASDGTFDLSP
jgi:hypothetical protein